MSVTVRVAGHDSAFEYTGILKRNVMKILKKKLHKNKLQYKSKNVVTGLCHCSKWKGRHLSECILCLIRKLPWASRPLHQANCPDDIGVNCPAIVREIPHVGLFPALPHFCENVLHFWLYFEISKNDENCTNNSCTETFCTKNLCKNVNDSVT